MDIEATQPLTQPFWNQPSAAKNDFSNLDDVICILSPGNELARKIVSLAAINTPAFILQNAPTPKTVDTEEDYLMQEDYLVKDPPTNISKTIKNPINAVGLPCQNLDLALRTSAHVRDLKLGFVFGREPARSDIVIKAGLDDTRISAMHFRIFTNYEAILMIQDTSTNGTFVDGHLLKTKAQRMICHHTIIEVVVGSVKETREMIKAKFIVNLPDRPNQERYYDNLQRYLHGLGIRNIDPQQARAKAADQDNARLSTMDPLLLIAGTARSTAGLGWNGDGRYNVIAEVGKGAFATVYKVATVSEGTVFAEKRLEKRTFIKNGVTDMKINNELEIMKHLNHDNIVRFYEWYETKQHLHMIMEFVPYGDLGIFVQETHFLGVANIKIIVREICKALDCIHSHGIVHRDIKPENILVASEAPLIVKLSDFGLSKMVGHDNKTFLKTFCGTLLYCAPEVYPGFQQRKNGKPLSRRTKEQSPYSSAVDIWSFGAVVFYLITSRPPYEGSAENGGARMLDVLLRESLPLRLMTQRGVNEAGVLLIKNMMSIDASYRPTARQCLEHEWLHEIGDTPDPSPIIVNPIPRSLDTVIEENGPSKSDDYALGVSESFERAAAGLVDAPPIKTQRLKAENGWNNDETWPQADASSQWDLRDPETAGSPSSDEESTEARMPKHDRSGASSRRQVIIGSATGYSLAYLNGGVRLADFGSSYHAADEEKSVIVEQAGLPDQAPHLKGHSTRLFGEVTASEVEESGVFGGVSLQPTVLPILPGANRAPQAVPASPSISFVANKRLREEDSTGEPQGYREPGKDEITEPPLKRSMLYTEYPESAKTSGSVEVTTQEVKDRISKLHFPLGTLTPVAGSCSDKPLKIYNRGMNFGRCPELTHVYPDAQDTRIPRLAIDIVFWRAGVAKDIEQGSQWQSLPGINAMIFTRSKLGIKVNGIRLNKASEETSFNCGRLRTGDIIEVFSGGGAFLKYRCAFFVGESLAERKPNEKFVVEQNSELSEELETAKSAIDVSNVTGSGALG